MAQPSELSGICSLHHGYRRSIWGLGLALRLHGLDTISKHVHNDAELLSDFDVDLESLFNFTDLEPSKNLEPKGPRSSASCIQFTDIMHGCCRARPSNQTLPPLPPLLVEDFHLYLKLGSQELATCAKLCRSLRSCSFSSEGQRLTERHANYMRHWA